MEADTYDFIKEDSVSSTYNPSDDELLKLVEEELAKGATKQFIVLHTDTTSSIGQDTSKSNKDGSIIPRFRSKNNIPTMINKVAIRYPFVLFSLKLMS